MLADTIVRLPKRFDSCLVQLFLPQEFYFDSFFKRLHKERPEMALEFISFRRNNEHDFKDITAEYFLKKIECIDCDDIKVTLPS